LSVGDGESPVAGQGDDRRLVVADGDGLADDVDPLGVREVGDAGSVEQVDPGSA